MQRVIFEMKKKLHKKFKSIVFISTTTALALSFAVVGVLHNKANVAVVQTSSFEDCLQYSGYVVRDEEVIYSSGQENNTMILYGNKQKVAKNSVIARVYDSPQSLQDAYAYNCVDSKLSLFQNQMSFDSTSISLLNKRISSIIHKLSSLDLNNSTNLNLYANLWRLLNEKEVEFGKSSCLNKKINELKSERDKLRNPEPIEYINSPSYGELIKDTDGFENILEFRKNWDYFEPESLKPEIYTKKPLGKLIKSETWYAILKVPYKEAERVKNSTEIILSAVDKDFAQNLPVVLEYVSDKDSSGNCVVVLSCDYMNEKLSYLRKESFKINLGNYWGIKISKKFITKQNISDERFGVYVKQSNYLKFKEVNIIFSGEDFVICEYGPEFYENDKYIQPGDRVVHSGANLYEGKKV